MSDKTETTPAMAGAAPAANDQSPDKIRGMFNSITPYYDRLNFLFSGSLDRVWRRRTARAVLAGLAPCAKVLDTATGTGDLARELLTRAGRMGLNGMRVTGADFTASMLARAGEKYPDARFEWVEADSLNLPFEDGEFDAATVAFGLRNMADKRRALAEMARVVRPGGRVAILEFGTPRNPLVRWGYDLYSFTIMPRLGYWISGTKAYLYLPESIRKFWGEDELADEMRGVGLDPVTVKPMTLGVVYLHIGTRRGA